MLAETFSSLKENRKAFAWLVDPDKCTGDRVEEQVILADKLGVDFIFVGGSLIFNHIDRLIGRIKPLTHIPVIIFPGSPLQISAQADAILLLSLISGRNPDYLIGNHVVAAPFLKESGLEILPTGYILVNGGRQTSVSYMSNTQPIPNNKPDIAYATAMAGEMLGLRIIYMDAGSGADRPISGEMIQQVSGGIRVPLIVGGGIRTPKQVKEAYSAGADVVVVGNAAEKNHGLLQELLIERDRFNNA
ncbi:MAG: geranylgeranylglyceryl/heptaprenylglyceryl phosphate synthase [Bacteroidetes bacterium GWF2_49_14]|nr:MAG: geranylgeranylglyceryl/heptaprenylglyceryl phosphate synthase [Bacteroidetes bacterium GWF2_49_14]HBB93326.1 geranylgeranylglyceryl/heptaprenylglyceryl phosphate synthase [Bacteroidales bacterium]